MESSRRVAVPSLVSVGIDARCAQLLGHVETSQGSLWCREVRPSLVNRTGKPAPRSVQGVELELHAIAPAPVAHRCFQKNPDSFSDSNSQPRLYCTVAVTTRP